MKKILIIEDHLMLSEEIKDWFIFERFETYTATNGIEGIDMALKYLPDIILCDIMMPEMDGKEVITTLQKNPSTRLIPFIFMTALSDRENIRSGMDLGADDYITKPFSRDELFNAVYRRLQKSVDIKDNAEAKVSERTIYLESTNKELEAFSYSVSHDLRAPLRAMDGYASMLLEDYAGVLDSEGNRKLNAIKDNAVKMGLLIDDLLSLSRLGMKELDCMYIDMSQLVKDICTELLIETGRDNIQFHTMKLHKAFGDLALVRQVWTNLLSNAIKYSSKKENPVIEISSCTKGNECIYTVKDNGAGFDMNYSDKLFGVFQRLHSSREFEGNGIGLANVKRIVLRLKGRVWAESKVGEGATFYFTLPLKP